MVKVDYTRDYYADLELPPTCSTEEIKKQFHKLALLYHPDRNPGHELEYNARFQNISAANEVLGDPEQRQQYDAKRRRGNVNNAFTRPPPPRRANQTNPTNPYQATSNFPPPPRRTNHRPAESPPAHPRGGAERYTTWANGRPPPPPRERPASSTQDAKDRANAFNAWQHMNHAQKQQHHHNQQQPKRPVPSIPPEAPMPPRPSSHPRPPTSNSPPKSAFATVNPPNSGPFRPDGNRVPRRPGPDPSTPLDDDGRPHSGASVYTAGPRYPAAQPPPAPSAPTPPPRGTAPTARRPEPELHARSSFPDQTSFPDATSPKVKTPYPAKAGEKTYFSREPLSRTGSFRDASKLQPNDDPRYLRRRSNSPPSERRAFQEPNNVKPRPVSTANPPFQTSYSSEDSEGETDEEKAQTTSQPYGSNTTTAPANQTGTNTRPTNQRGPFNSFTFPLQSDTFTRTSSHEFVGSSVSPPKSSGSGMHRAESHPNMFSFGAQALEEEMIQMPPPPASAGTKFPADQWTKSVQEENWASRWAEPQGGQISPPKGGQTTRKTRGPGPRVTTRANANPNAPTTPQPASVEEEERGDPSMFTGAQRANTPDSNAMDIDDDAPSAPPMDRQPSIVVDGAPDGSNKPHVSFQEPASADNLQEPPNNMFERRSSLPENFYSESNASQPRAPSPRLSSQLSMDDFRHVYPFEGSSSAGLGSMKDLSSELPFPSQASTGASVSNEDLSGAPFNVLPQLPKAPLTPQKKLTQNNWAFYLEQMYRYLEGWNKFNSQMVAHFEASAKALKAFEVHTTGVGLPASEGGSGVVPGWLGTWGETKDLKGWNTYLAMLKEDERWREHWRLGCERHAHAIERHSELRQQIIDGGLKS